MSSQSLITQWATLYSQKGLGYFLENTCNRVLLRRSWSDSWYIFRPGEQISCILTTAVWTGNSCWPFFFFFLLLFLFFFFFSSSSSSSSSPPPPPPPPPPLLLLLLLLLLFLLWRYNSDRVLAFSTISFNLRRSCTCSAHFISFVFFRSFLTSPSHRDLGLPAGLPVNGFHLCILFTMLVSGILFMCPNQLNRWGCWSLLPVTHDRMKLWLQPFARIILHLFSWDSSLFPCSPNTRTAVAQWLRCCATNWKVAGSIPDGVIGIFYLHNPSDRTMALGSTQPLKKMSTRNISWG